MIAWNESILTLFLRSAHADTQLEAEQYLAIALYRAGLSIEKIAETFPHASRWLETYNQQGPYAFKASGL